MIGAAFFCRLAKRYTKTHEWIDVIGSIGTVGISTYSAFHLGDMIAVGRPEVGRPVKAGDEMCDLESSKATVPVTAPLAGTIIGFNAELAKKPGLINTSAELDGWIVKLEVADPSAAQSLMDQAAYRAFLSHISL
jgi:glycine cleavage system H protein